MPLCPLHRHARGLGVFGKLPRSAARGRFFADHHRACHARRRFQAAAAQGASRRQGAISAAHCAICAAPARHVPSPRDSRERAQDSIRTLVRVRGAPPAAFSRFKRPLTPTLSPFPSLSRGSRGEGADRAHGMRVSAQCAPLIAPYEDSPPPVCRDSPFIKGRVV
jgi:hypothetical protein